MASVWYFNSFDRLNDFVRKEELSEGVTFTRRNISEDFANDGNVLCVMCRAYMRPAGVICGGKS